MKKAVLLFVLLPFCLPKANAQRNNGLYKTTYDLSSALISGTLMGENDGYCSLNFSSSYLFYPGRDGVLRISFPYTAIGSSGSTTHNVFTSKGINPYPIPKPLFGGSFEIGNAHHFLDMRISGSQGAIKYSLGYGLNFYAGMAGRPPEKRLLIFKPSLNIERCRYYENELGTIDNKNTTIEALGCKADPLYTLKSDKSKTPCKANKLDVLFAQNNYSLVPKISISTNRYRYMLNVQMDFGYYFVLAQRTGIQLIQYADNNTYKHDVKNPGVVDISNNSITATFNNKAISGSPYTFSGFFIGLNVGLNCNRYVMPLSKLSNG